MSTFKLAGIFINGTFKKPIIKGRFGNKDSGDSGQNPQNSNNGDIENKIDMNVKQINQDHENESAEKHLNL